MNVVGVKWSIYGENDQDRSLYCGEGHRNRKR